MFHLSFESRKSTCVQMCTSVMQWIYEERSDVCASISAHFSRQRYKCFCKYSFSKISDRSQEMRSVVHIFSHILTILWYNKYKFVKNYVFLMVHLSVVQNAGYLDVSKIQQNRTLVFNKLNQSFAFLALVFLFIVYFCIFCNTFWTKTFTIYIKNMMRMATKTVILLYLS